MKSKTLFIVDNYLPTVHANGVCVKSLVEAANKETDASVLTFKSNERDKSYDIINHTEIYRIKPSLYIKTRDNYYNLDHKYNKVFSKIIRFSNAVKKLLLIPLYPVTEMFSGFRLTIKVLKLTKVMDIRRIVMVYKPVTILFPILFKKRLNGIELIVYNLDSFQFSPPPRYLSKAFFKKRMYKIEQYVINNVNKYIVLNSYEDLYNKEDFARNISFSGIPLFEVSNSQTDLTFNFGPVINFIYAGAVSHVLRNPKHCCETIEEYSRTYLKECEVTFYSRGATDILRGFDLVQVKEYLPHQELLKKYQESDILISIGNHQSIMLPSKTIEYINLRKPIIHFSSSAQDVALHYLSKYPLALVINQDNGIEKNIKMMNNFINELDNKNLNLIKKDIDIFYKEYMVEFTAEYTNKIIYK